MRSIEAIATARCIYPNRGEAIGAGVTPSAGGYGYAGGVTIAAGQGCQPRRITIWLFCSLPSQDETYIQDRTSGQDTVPIGTVCVS